ncbi:MAG: DUF1501 domain-containing protein [Ignavibacteriae bacterium]|nr:DUF1501 domain-containing protein [Ignavibacteriota bacterium]
MKRRDFVKQSLLASAGVASVPLVFGGIPVHAGSLRAHRPEAWAQNDNILVVIQMFGGNDGLNAFVPFTDSRYYERRPTIGIPPAQVLKIANPTMGFHPQMTGMRNLFESGKLAAVQGVGYENANRSHFRSQDIWLTGSGAAEVLHTGWLGRWLEATYPTFPLQLPPDPFAVQIGGTLSLMLQSRKGNMGITLADPDIFFKLGRNVIDEAVPSGTPYGDEYLFIRAIKEQSDTYSQRVNDAFNAGRNVGTYASGGLAQQLRLVARLISGGLKSRVFMVYLGGFDTHSNQLGGHASLLKSVSDAAEQFILDLQNQGLSKNVVGLTMSEFGRRTHENGSSGTDHGTASVQFVFGEPVNSGVLGADPDFDVTDSSGDLVYTFEYRQIYSELLEHWFDVPKDDVTQLLNGRFIPLPLIRSSSGAADPSAVREFELLQNHPNPVAASGETTLGFILGRAAPVELLVYDATGRQVAVAARGRYEAGRHRVPVSFRDAAPGAYFYQLRVDGQQVTRTLLVR